METKKELQWGGEGEEALPYCSQSHHEVQNLCCLTIRGNASEREWNTEEKLEIMKTSLISADTSSRLSCHCWNQYKFLKWDALKKAWLWQLSHLLSHWNNQQNCTPWKTAYARGGIQTSPHAPTALLYRWYALYSRNQFNRAVLGVEEVGRTASPCC